MNKNKPLIAVIDDEVLVRVAMERLLRSHGMDVKTYASGAEFLAAEIRQFDCVVLDLHMPHMDGHEVLSRFSQLATRIPVIVITGHDTPEARARVMAAGAAMYLLKPVDARTMLDAIAAATLLQKGP